MWRRYGILLFKISLILLLHSVLGQCFCLCVCSLIGGILFSTILVPEQLQRPVFSLMPARQDALSTLLKFVPVFLLSFPLCSEISGPKTVRVYVIYCRVFSLIYLVLQACYMCFNANFLIFFFFEICRKTLTKVEELLPIFNFLAEPDKISNLFFSPTRKLFA